MRSVTGFIRSICVVAALAAAQDTRSQTVFGTFVDEDPVITVTYAVELTGKHSNNATKMGVILAEQHVVGQMISLLDKWNNEYNDYLKDSLGIAKSIKIGTTLYTEGAILLRNLYTLQKAVRYNPQGVVSTAVMNDLYKKTAVTVIRTYNLLKKVLTKGGPDHMLTGAERLDILWEATNEIRLLNKTFRKLSISIAYYDLADVWNRATSGIIELDTRQIARRCLDDWRKTYKAVQILE